MRALQLARPVRPGSSTECTEPETADAIASNPGLACAELLTPARAPIFADGVDGRVPSLVSLGGPPHALSVSARTAVSAIAAGENDR